MSTRNDRGPTSTAFARSPSLADMCSPRVSTIYPEFALDAERWLDPAMRFAVLDRADVKPTRPRAHGRRRRLGKPRLTVSDRRSPPGDRIVCLRNSDRPRRQKRHLRNRRADRPRQRTLMISTDRGPTFELSRRYLEPATSGTLTR